MIHFGTSHGLGTGALAMVNRYRLWCSNSFGSFYVNWRLPLHYCTYNQTSGPANSLQQEFKSSLYHSVQGIAHVCTIRRLQGSLQANNTWMTKQDPRVETDVLEDINAFRDLSAIREIWLLWQLKRISENVCLSRKKVCINKHWCLCLQVGIIRHR